MLILQMRIKAKNQGKVKIEEIQMQEVDGFRYLESYIMMMIMKETSSRISSAAAHLKQQKRFGDQQDIKQEPK